MKGKNINMLITDENEIIKNIKASYRKMMFIHFLYLFIVTLLVFCVSHICWVETKKINFITIFVFIISGVVIFYFLRSFYLSFKKYISPRKYGILKIYPNFFDIINEINDTVEYQDRKLIISTNYLISKTDYTCLIFLNNLDRICIANETNRPRFRKFNSSWLLSFFYRVRW